MEDRRLKHSSTFFQPQRERKFVWQWKGVLHNTRIPEKLKVSSPICERDKTRKRKLFCFLRRSRTLNSSWIISIISEWRSMCLSLLTILPDPQTDFAAREKGCDGLSVLHRTKVLLKSSLNILNATTEVQVAAHGWRNTNTIIWKTPDNSLRMPHTLSMQSTRPLTACTTFSTAHKLKAADFHLMNFQI